MDITPLLDALDKYMIATERSRFLGTHGAEGERAAIAKSQAADAAGDALNAYIEDRIDHHLRLGKYLRDG